MRVLRRIAIALATLTIILLVGPFLIPIPPLTGVESVENLADSESHFIQIHGIKVHYKISGKGGPAIILLHGFGASTFSWREVAGPLGAYGTVVAYDRPAFGLTERPLQWTGQNPYGPEAQVDLLFGLMDGLKIDRAVLVGNSAGGTVAMQAALAHPERVQALVLVDPAVYGGGSGPAWLHSLYQTPQMDRLGVLLARTISTRGMDILYNAWHDRSRITSDITAGYRKPLRAENWDVAFWQFTRASHPVDLARYLDKFQMPVLVVTGDDDRIVPTANSLRLAREIPGANSVVLPGCGHVPQEECPQPFLAVVLPFIQSINP